MDELVEKINLLKLSTTNTDNDITDIIDKLSQLNITSNERAELMILIYDAVKSLLTKPRCCVINNHISKSKYVY